MKTTLIIMAAGKSSRYGSLKQTELIGPCNVTLMEYSMYDAISAGFTDVILIIRKETKTYFETIKNRIGRASPINEIRMLLQLILRFSTIHKRVSTKLQKRKTLGDCTCTFGLQSGLQHPICNHQC